MGFFNRLKNKFDRIPHKKKQSIFIVSFLLVFGTILLSVGLGVLFGYVRPFETWHKVNCNIWNLNIFNEGHKYYRVIYFDDNIKYENVIYINHPNALLNGATFWYNARNANDIIFGKDTLTIVMSIFIAFGTILIISGIIGLSYIRKKFMSCNFEDWSVS